MSEKELTELKSGIGLLKKIAIKLANITVQAGFNCTYPEENELYDLISKLKE